VTRRGLTAASLRAHAIRLLARREYTRRELEERLGARGAAREELGLLLDELESQGYLSNQRYAKTVVAQKAGHYSRRAIAGALEAKGVDRDDIVEALEESDLDDSVALKAIWRRRFGAPPADERQKARQVRFLQARGFALSAILRLLRESGR
jgi:regulatory protein